MGNKIKVGVIGAGKIAQIAHLPILASREDVEITAVMTRHPESVLRAQKQFGALHAVESLAEMAALGVDCAFILSPKACHASQTAELLERGVDVFCEKPMAMTLSQAEEMARLARRCRRKLMIGFNRRFAPVYQQAKAAYADQPPDVVIAQKSKPSPAYRATLENAIHIVDLLRFLCGECTDVQAIARYEDPCYERLATAQMQFENGSVGILVADRAPGQWLETVEIHGGGRSVYANFPDEVTVTDARESHTTRLGPLAQGMARVEDKLGFRAEIEHFLDCIRSDREPLTNGEDALKTHELVDRILKSAGLPDLDSE